MGALVWVAGGALMDAIALASAMLGLQFAIGAVNDLVDEAADARSKPAKPIPSGLVSRRAAAAIALVSAGWGLAVSATFGPVVLVLALAMLGAGLLYDVVLKPTAIAGLAFALAFPLLPVYAWWAAAAALPPRPEFLLPVAMLAGPTLQLANGLVDIERDSVVGLRGPVVRLGRERAWAALLVLSVIIHGIALASLIGVPASRSGALLAAVVASGVGGIGVALSASTDPGRRERGWQAQAVAVVLLGVGWTLAVR